MSLLSLAKTLIAYQNHHTAMCNEDLSALAPLQLATFITRAKDYARELSELSWPPALQPTAADLAHLFRMLAKRAQTALASAA